MIQEFVNRFMERKEQLEQAFSKHPENYAEIVKNVITAISDEDTYDDPDPERIHQIDDGDWQGTLVYVIAAKDYQPSDYWYVRVSYGSCSGCDTLERIKDYSDDTVTVDQLSQYMTLALHIVQGLKKMGEDTV